MHQQLYEVNAFRMCLLISVSTSSGLTQFVILDAH